jgi:hypothetical protein
LDETLLKEVKHFATERGGTLTSIIEEALREKLARRETFKARAPFEPKVFKGKGRGLKPGVDLDDNSALLDLMEGR